jgi:hypothetical protein
MKFTVILGIAIIVAGCSGEQSSSHSENEQGTISDSSEITNDISLVEEEQLDFADLKTYSGKLGENDIYLEFSIDKDRAEGYYYYTSNFIKFDLSGTVNADKIELFRMKDDQIRETFSFNSRDGKGKWTKENQTEKLILNEITSEVEGSFLNLSQWLDDQKTSLIGSYHLDNLEIKDHKIVGQTSHRCHFNSTKIYYDDSYENDAGGFDASVQFFTLYEDEFIQIAQVQVINHYEYSDDEDEGEVNQTYTVSIRIVATDAGENIIDQEIHMEGPGSALADLIENTVVVQREGQTDIFEYSNTEFEFIEK